jgi:5-oxoprolinase (ATP-hydrolysing)
VRASAVGSSLPPATEVEAPGPLPSATGHRAVFHAGGEQETLVYSLKALKPGHSIPGPAIIIDAISTIVVEPYCTAHITPRGDVRIVLHALPEHHGEADSAGAESCDPIQLAIFSHRFMSIAEQMGRALQRSSISVNIKERLDFSCALFGPDGTLVANAPHLPVHLGAMSEAVKAQIAFYSGMSRSSFVLHLPLRH